LAENGWGSDDHDCRVAEREHEADGDRPLTFQHQLTGYIYIVDCGDVIGVCGMP
jgi:hypothetical protein